MIRIMCITCVLVFSASANAQIFKCKKPDGSIEFSEIPCRGGVGEAELALKHQWQAADIATQEEARNADLANRVSTEIMSAPRNPSQPVRVTVVKDSGRKKTLQELYEEKARSSSNREQPKAVRTICNSFGSTTACRSSDGTRSTTSSVGKTSYTTTRPGSQ